MRSISAGRFATLLFFCAVIVQAYPGGQLVRSFIEGTSTVSMAESSSIPGTQSTMEVTGTQSSSSLTSKSASEYPMFAISSTSSASFSMPTQVEPRGLLDGLPLLSAQGGVYLDESPDGNDVDYEDDCDGEEDFLYERDIHFDSFSGSLDSIMSKLEDIHSMLQDKTVHTPLQKRQWNDVLDQEQGETQSAIWKDSLQMLTR